MRKLLSVLLSVTMTICVLQVAYVQVTALENNNYSTADEADVEPVSVEVVKAPESVVMFGSQMQDSEFFWNNVEVKIRYNNGSEEYYNCSEMYEKGVVVVKEEPSIELRSDILSVDNQSKKCKIEFWIENKESVRTVFTVNIISNPYRVLNCEMNKLPEKTFTAPLWTGNLENESKLNIENSIANNMNGAELTIEYENGERKILVLGKDVKPIKTTNKSSEYSVKLDSHNCLKMSVCDLGDYVASVFLTVEFRLDESDAWSEGLGSYFKFTAKSSSNTNPSKPSGNISSATSDVATNDNANNNNSTNGTANNGVVATGNFATPAIITVVMLSAVAVMFVFKRKRVF